MENSGDGEGREDSLFSVLRPVEPVRHTPPPAAPPPPRQEDALLALNQRIANLEKNILAQLENRALERGAPGAEPAPLAPAAKENEKLQARIAELESRLREFQERALSVVVSSKNIEETKAATRKEIEELLKVVREQQKYSEMDRQIHEQLEKSWHRVEELEKRLMDFYSGLAKNPAQPQFPMADLEKILGAVLDRKLTEICSLVEARIKQAELSSGGRLEEFVRKAKELFDHMEESLARQAAVTASRSEDYQRLHAEAELRRSAETEKLASVFGDQVEALRKELSDTGLRLAANYEDFSVKMETSTAGISGHLDALRKEMARAELMLIGNYSDFKGKAEEQAAGIKRLEGIVSGFFERQYGLISEKVSFLAARTVSRDELDGMVGALRDTLMKHLSAEAGALRSGEEERYSALSGRTVSPKEFEYELKRLKEVLLEGFAREANGVKDAEDEKYSAIVNRVSAAQEAVDAIDQSTFRIKAAAEAMAPSAKDLEKINPDSLLGVTGMILRRNLDFLKGLPGLMSGAVAEIEKTKKSAQAKLTAAFEKKPEK